MARSFILGGLLMAVAAFPVFSEDKHDHHAAATSKNAGLEKLKSLAGTWVTADKDGKPTEEVGP